MKNQLKNATVIILVASTYIYSSLAAELSWPQAEVGASESGFSESGMEQLDKAMRQIVANQDVAGMVWMLAKDGNVATFETSGFARIDDQTPMEKDTLFRIYSMTKPVTGVALMVLHEQGLWEFDDPVNQAFREQQVLASSNLVELVNKVAEIPLLSQPGEQWYYSVAVDIQGYIVQKLAGMSYGDFLEQHIFGPLGMTDTRFFVTEEDQSRFAEVHNWDSERNRIVQRPHRKDRPNYLDANRLESGGGGLVSSIHDYARFLQMLVNEGTLEGTKILTPESVRIMRTNSLRDELDIRGGPDRPGQAGVGFGVDFAVIYDPELAKSAQGPGTYYWSGAAGTWFWIDPSKDMFWIGMIQARGQRRPGAANMRSVVTDIVYDTLND